MNSLSKKLSLCHKYVDLAKKAAIDLYYDESNMLWKKAANISSDLLTNNDHGSFLDEEYKFLIYIENHFKDINNETDYN